MQWQGPAQRPQQSQGGAEAVHVWTILYIVKTGADLAPLTQDSASAPQLATSRRNRAGCCQLEKGVNALSPAAAR